MSQGGFWRYENRLILILMFAFGVVFLDRNAYGYLAPFIMPELGMNNTQHGFIISGLSLTWAASAFLIGMLSDASGKRKLILIVCMVVFSLCSVLSGLAGSFLMLILARTVMGLSEGGMHPVVQSLVMLESSEERRGVNMGVTQNVGSQLVGTITAPILLIWVAEHFDWRVSFYLAAVPGLILAFIVWKFVREPEMRAFNPLARDAAAGGREKEGILTVIAKVYTTRNIWLCSIISCFMVAWMVLGWTFMPLFFAQARHIPADQMSYLVSAPGFVAIACAFLVPALSDRIGRRPVVIAFCFIALATPLGALYLSSNIWLVGIVTCLGWSASGIFPIFMSTIPSETLPVRYLSTSIGVIVGIGEAVGGVLSPIIAGRAGDLYGLDSTMWVMAACALVSGVVALMITETAPVKLRKLAAQSQPAE